MGIPIDTPLHLIKSAIFTIIMNSFMSKSFIARKQDAAAGDALTTDGTQPRQKCNMLPFFLFL